MPPQNPSPRFVLDKDGRLIDTRPAPTQLPSQEPFRKTPTSPVGGNKGGPIDPNADIPPEYHSPYEEEIKRLGGRSGTAPRVPLFGDQKIGRSVDVTAPGPQMGQDMIKAILTGLGVASSAIPGGPGALLGPTRTAGLGTVGRTLIPMATGGMNAGIDSGGEDLPAMLEEMIKQGGLALIGEGGGKLIPEVGNATALTLGGAKDVGNVVKAASEVRAQRSPTPLDWFKPGRGNLSVGNPKGLKAEEKVANATKQRVEEASPAKATGNDFMGATAREEKRASYSDRPASAPVKVKAEDEELAQELVAKRLGVPVGVIKQWRTSTPASAARTGAGFNPVTTSPAKAGGPRLTDQDMEFLLGKTSMSAREGKEFVRGLRNPRIAEARTSGAPISDEDFARDAINTSRSEQLNTRLNAEERRLLGTPDGQLSPMEAADRHRANLYVMEKANKELRGGGGVRAPLGQLTTRAALGGGIGATAAAAASAAPQVGFGLGSILGLLGLAPRVMSSGSSMMGRAAQVTPLAVRLKQLDEELNQAEGKKPVQRKKPGGGQ